MIEALQIEFARFTKAATEEKKLLERRVGDEGGNYS